MTSFFDTFFISAGTVFSPARLAAKNLLSPAIIIKLLPCGRTVIGFIIPCSFMELASSSMVLSSKVFLG